MKEKILELKKQGLSYSKIVTNVGCSKSLVAYYCGEGQKEKTRIRTRKHRNSINGILLKKISQFKLNKERTGSNNDNTILFIDKIKSSLSCYLTGRDIDLSKRREYNLDHITPLSKGGDSSVCNMGVACRDANMSKFDFVLDDYIQLCKEVCENFGYKVIKY